MPPEVMASALVRASPSALAVVDSDAADARACRRILAEGSRSFAAASWLLPAWARDDAAAFYAFCRQADDAIDLGDDPCAALARLSLRLDRIYAGAPSDDPVERALARTVARCGVPRAVFDALLDGFAWDAMGTTIRDEKTMLAYAARVAATIGVVMTLVLGVRDADALARACDLGVAMQLTNIARDVGEDARNGRVYLPDEWLAEAGLTRAEVLAMRSCDDRLAAVVARLLDRAEELYRRAEVGIAALPARARPAIRAARIIYADIGRVLRRQGCDPLRGRAHTSLARKLVLLVRARLAREVVTPALAEPALSEVTFLIDAVVPGARVA